MEGPRHASAQPTARAAGQEHRSWRQALAYGLATAGPILVAGCVTPALTRLLGAEDYGELALGLSVAQVGQIPLVLGLAAAINRHVRVAESGARGALGIALVGSMLAIALGLGVLLVALPLTSSIPTVRVGVVSAAALGAFGLLQSVMVGLGRAWTFAVHATLISAVSAVSGLTWVLLMSESAFHYLVVLTTAQFALVTAFYVRAVSTHGATLRRGEYREAIRLGIPTVPHQLASMAVPALSVMLAGTMLGDVRGAGELQLVFLIASLPAMAVAAINNAWAVNAYSTPHEVRSDYLSRTATQMAKIAILGALTTNLASPWVVRYLASPDMDSKDMVTAVGIVTASVTFTVIYFTNIHQVFASGRTGLLAVTTPLSAVGALLVSGALVLLFPRDAMIALACGVVVFQALQVVASTWLRKRAGMDRLWVALPLLFAAVGLAQGAVIALLPMPPLLRSALLATCVALGVRQVRRLEL